MNEQDFQTACRKHKSALTRAKKSNDPQKLKAAGKAALTFFEDVHLYPDHWHMYQNAVDDAEYAIARGRNVVVLKGDPIERL
jgi:hypothetical protein